MITAERTVSYDELDRAANGVASIVTASDGFGSHPVAFWGDRSVATVAAVWGLPRAGVAAVALDSRLPPAVAMGATRSAGVRGLWVAPEGGIDRLIERGASASETARPEVSYVVSTSGSGGKPKGVALTDDNVRASVAASRFRLGNGSDDRWLCVLPLHHVGGLSILWRQAEAGGAVVLHERFDANAVADALGDVTFASVVPVMLRRILAVDGRDWSGLKTVLVGGAHSDVELLETARKRGIPAVPTYGMTETCSQIATPLPQAPLDGTLGEPLQGAEIRVVADGRPVIGVEGRIEVRGPMVSPGYVGEPTRAADDWLITNDLGILDDDGHLRVLGRSDRVIVTGGENVHPAAVERLLGRNPSILTCRVFGEPDQEWGTRVVAEVQTDLDAATLEAWAEDRLPPGMRPRHWRIVDHPVDKLTS